MIFATFAVIQAIIFGVTWYFNPDPDGWYIPGGLATSMVFGLIFVGGTSFDLAIARTKRKRTLALWREVVVIERRRLQGLKRYAQKLIDNHYAQALRIHTTAGLSHNEAVALVQPKINAQKETLTRFMERLGAAKNAEDANAVVNHYLRSFSW